MSFGGGIKIFKKSKSLGKDGATIVASTGDAISSNAIDRNVFTLWESVGSNDSTKETLTVTISSTALDRILLLNHNFKDYNVMYSQTDLFTISVTQQGTGGVPEITDVTVPTGAAMPPGAYFNLFSAADATSYYVWFDKDNTSTDPAPSGKTGIEVNIADTDTDAQVAAKGATAINAIGDFGATDSGAIISAWRHCRPRWDCDICNFRYTTSSLLSN